MKKIDLVIDGIIPARNALILLNKGNKKSKLNVSYINSYPIKIGEFKIITPDQVLEFDEASSMFKFKEDVDKDVKEFYNIQLTNHLNMYLHILSGAYIDDYVTDIDDVVEAAATDSDTKDALIRFNTDLTSTISLCNIEDYLLEIESLVPNDAVTAIYPRNIVTSYVSKDEMPPNKYLESGKVMNVSKGNPDPKVTKLYDKFTNDIISSKLYIYMDDNDNEYFVVRKTDNMFYIAKIPLQIIFKLSKFIPV